MLGEQSSEMPWGELKKKKRKKETRKVIKEGSTKKMNNEMTMESFVYASHCARLYIFYLY